MALNSVRASQSNTLTESALLETSTEAALLLGDDSDLEKLFRASPPGDIPIGATDGTAILAPGRRINRVLATAAGVLAWRGKVVDPDGTGLSNRITPFDVHGIRASVYRAGSWLDGGDCIVIDYSKTSLVARGVRDEIRLVAPRLYLGLVWLWRRRVAWFLLRVPEAGQDPGTAVFRRSASPHQVAVTVRAPIQRGREAAVEGLLAELRSSVERDREPFRSFTGVHFARTFRVPGALDIPDTLVYMCDVDASADDHLRDLAQDTGPLGALFEECEDYPPQGGPRAAAHRWAWLQRHRIPAAASYVHRIGRSLRQIQGEAYLRSRIEELLDQSMSDWVGRSEVEVHRAVRAFVRSQPELCWALRPAPPPEFAFRLREGVHKVALPALFVALLPVLAPVLPVWAALIRRLERRDVPHTARPSRQRLGELEAIEDFATQNPFTAAGTVKPGLVRRLTFNAALRAIDYGNRHIYGTDNLAGIRSIHFARWVPIDSGRRLIFASNYDGSQESYMDDFIDKVAWALNLVFSNGVGYPRTRWLIKEGAQDEQAFKFYLRNHQLTSVWYTAYGDLSARNIDDNSELRDGLTRDLSPRQARAWSRLL